MKIQFVKNGVWRVLFLFHLVISIKFCHVVNMRKNNKERMFNDDPIFQKNVLFPPHVVFLDTQ